MAIWLALRFPHWALDSRLDATGGEFDTPTLVVEAQSNRRVVVAASAPALRAGVRCGMALTDAHIHAPEAGVFGRCIAGEQAALERLAGWAWRYSDQIHIARADEDIECTRLVLEIGASQRLYGGRRPLLNRIRTDLDRLGYRCRTGLGTSPQAALALARTSGRNRHKGGLEQLPLTCLALDTHTRASLVASGLRLAGELLALPPATLARRYGTGVLNYLERLRARRPHGLCLHVLPEFYRTRHEFTDAVETMQGLTFVLRRAFIELATFLRGANAVIQTLEITLIHESAIATRLTLRLSAPTREADHLERVANDRLTRTTLAAPVLEIALASDRLRSFEQAQDGLWHGDGARGQSRDNWPAVLDRLRARLGHDAVRWLHAAADHRPEYATVYRGHPPAQDPVAGPPRPLWLLDAPRRFTGPLELIAGPERIETGWWDGRSIRRDYFRALDPRGRLLWVYRDLVADLHGGPPVYYLHGLFG